MKKLLLVLCFLPGLALGQKNMTEVRPEIRLILSDKTIKRWADAEVDSAWNRAQRLCGLWAGILIARQDTISTAAGLEQYAMNSDFFRLNTVWRGAGVNKKPVAIISNPYDLLLMGAQAPTEYCWIHGSQLFLWPVPTGIERIYITYYGEPTLLGTVAAATLLPSILHQAPVWEAASILINAEGRYDLSAQWHSRALEIVNAYRGLVSQTQDKGEPKK